MKTVNKLAVGVLALAASAWMLTAQDSQPQQGDRRPPRREGSGGPGGPGREGQRPPPPVIAALDANHDGVIDAQEIADASKSLLKLDANGDGKLTRDELFPPPPDGDAGGRAPEGRPKDRPQQRN